ncbi:hypothetical protein PR048_027385 [Dryococelus australis]|uniref:MADF domain-containing protein n=1 Tax=Dryococelus australis TaxID=614101 RepID=A0ABQ9GGN5_9NEOP|nr:hypothetical protein PR048_027385 [Dryococelus australis]
MFDIDKLIDHIHEKSALWDKSVKEYSDKQCRERHGSELGENMYEDWLELELRSAVQKRKTQGNIADEEENMEDDKVQDESDEMITLKDSVSGDVASARPLHKGGGICVALNIQGLENQVWCSNEMKEQEKREIPEKNC